MRILPRIATSTITACVVWTAGLPGLHSQMPAPSLERLEAAYSETVRRSQAAVMQQYLGDLQALLARSSGSDADAVRFEIARVHKLMSEGTVIDVAPSIVTPEVSGNGTGKRKHGIVFSLDPDEAEPVQAKGDAVALGTATWRLSRLQSGTYELIALCACPKLPEGSPSISVAYQGQTIQYTMQPGNRTKDENSFRPITLGRFTIKEAAINGAVVVTASGSPPWVRVKKIIITVIDPPEPK